MGRDYTDSMARRGFAILFTLLGVALFVSIVGFALLYLLFGREPAVPVQRHARAAGRRRSLTEIAPADVVGYLRGVADADGALDRRQPAQGEGRSAASRAVLLKPTGFESPFWAQGPGNPRRGARLPEVRQAGLRLSRIRRRPRVLPRDRGRQGLPDAVGAARSERRRDLRAVPARHARQDRRVSRPAPHRRLQDRGQHLHGEGLHRRAQGDGRVAEPRSVRADRPRHRRRPQEERSRRAAR